MASIKGGLFVKGKSEEAISNNGAYFVDLTNATESSGTYTIPSADIENGDFTLQVGDLLVDKNSGNLLKVATLTPDITADLVVEASSGGGGKQLYQHNVDIHYYISATNYHAYIQITNDSNEEINTLDKVKNYLRTNGHLDTSTGHIASGKCGNAKIVGAMYYGNNGLLQAYDGSSGNNMELNAPQEVKDTINPL